jgi:MFS family permease
MGMRSRWRLASSPMSRLISYIREFGRFQRNARLYLISNALSGVTIGIILVLYNLYLVSLGYKTDFVGLVLFVTTIGAGIAIFPAGVIVDHVGGKAILIWASVAIGVAGAGQMLFRQPLPLLISGFLAGVAGAFVLVVNAPYLTINSTPVERPHLFSLNIVVTLAATVLGEALGGALPLWFRDLPALMAPLPPWCAWMLAGPALPRSYQLALLLSGVIALPSFVPLFMLSDDRPAPRPAPPASEGTQTGKLSLPGMIGQLLRVTLPAALVRLRKTPLKALIFSPLFVLTVMQALVGAGAGLFMPYFNIYFVQHLGASSALFGLIDGGANALNAVLTLAAPWLAQRIGKINTITVTRLLSIPLMLTIGLAGLLPLVAALYLFRQGAMDMSQGVLQAFSMEAVPRERRGVANSSYQAAYQVAWALTAPIGGLIIARLSYAPVFIAGAVLYLLAIAVLWGRFRHDEGTLAV